MPTNNMERAVKVRVILATEGIRYYKLADALGVSYATVNRWMRSGLTEEKYDKIMAALATLRGGGPID